MLVPELGGIRPRSRRRCRRREPAAGRFRFL